MDKPTKSSRKKLLIWVAVSVIVGLLIGIQIGSRIAIKNTFHNYSDYFVACSKYHNDYSDKLQSWYKELAKGNLGIKIPPDEIQKASEDLTKCWNGFYDKGPIIINVGSK